jgi:hypothetical protein
MALSAGFEPKNRQFGIEGRKLVSACEFTTQRRWSPRLWRWAGPGLLLLGAAVLSSGCAVHPSGPHGPACQEIEAATHILEHSSQRLVILKRIAKQKNLSQHEQSYLVNAVFMGGSFGSDMADALINLIDNPCYTTQTQQEILRHLSFFVMHGQAHRRILDEMKKHPERGEVPEAG